MVLALLLAAATADRNHTTIRFEHAILTYKFF